MSVIGRMQRRLTRDAENKTAERVGEHLEASGRDGLEMAARVACAAYRGVKPRLPANREYRTGYAMALAELAVVLRCMRRGEPPATGEMAVARRATLELIEEEFYGLQTSALTDGDGGPGIINGPVGTAGHSYPCARCDGRKRIPGPVPGLDLPCPECSS